MDNGTLAYLLALKDVNVALTEGLKVAVVALEKFDRASPEMRHSLINSLNELISSSEKAYKDVPTQH